MRIFANPKQHLCSMRQCGAGARFITCFVRFMTPFGRSIWNESIARTALQIRGLWTNFPKVAGL
jgi:hypothetical protein